jgi:glycosyltransferase involved in cell wall biosynthesis
MINPINDTAPKVAVITPTYNRDPRIIERCLRTVQWQTYSNIDHYVCHDGPWEDTPEVRSLIANYNDRITWTNTPERTDTYGAGVRQFVLDRLPEEVKYVVHLDDDNVIFPDFIKEHADTLEKYPEVDFSICKIVHNGPLPTHMGAAPKIISGVPPTFKNIDTLQVMVRAKAMRECGWVQYQGHQGYCNDGYTYQRLGELSRWVEIPKLLAIHI